MILLKSKQNLKYFYIAFCFVFFFKIKYVTAFVCLFLVLCLQLISPSSERIFQAVTDQEVQEWVTAIQVFKISCDQLRIISSAGFIRYKNIIFSLFMYMYVIRYKANKGVVVVVLSRPSLLVWPSNNYRRHRHRHHRHRHHRTTNQVKSNVGFW